MSDHHAKSLIVKLAQLKSEIEREKCALQPNWTRLRQLKKQRLMFKDELLQLKFSTSPPHRATPARKGAGQIVEQPSA